MGSGEVRAQSDGAGDDDAWAACLLGGSQAVAGIFEDDAAGWGQSEF